MGDKKKTTPKKAAPSKKATPTAHRRPGGEAVMTAEQAADFAGVGIDTIRHAIKLVGPGRLKGTDFPPPIGIRTTKDAVLDWIESGGAIAVEAAAERQRISDANAPPPADDGDVVDDLPSPSAAA